MKKLLVLSLMVAMIQMPALANVTYSFNAITANSVADVLTGEAQLSVEVSSYGTNQALFTFSNAGPLASSITQIYFRDGSLLAPIAAIRDKDDAIGGVYGLSGVDFSQGANPILPGGGNAWKVSEGFIVDSAGSDSAVQPNGVNPGEWVQILFNLQSGSGFQDVIDELADTRMQIGIHVQGFASGSESFVNGPPTVVPAPAAILLGGIGVSLVGWLRRKRAL